MRLKLFLLSNILTLFVLFFAALFITQQNTFAMDMTHMAGMYMVEKVTVTNNHQPVENAIVTIQNSQGVTNKQGVAELENVSSGDQFVTIVSNGRKTQQPIHIMSDTMSISYLPQKSTPIPSGNFIQPLSMVLMILSLMGFVFVAFYLFLKIRKNKTVYKEEGVHSKVQHLLAISRHIIADEFHLSLSATVFLLLFLVTIYAVGHKHLTFAQQAVNGSSTVAYDASLPVPSTPHVEADDRNAILSWDDLNGDAWFQNIQAEKDFKTPGYIIYWGIVDPSSETIISPTAKITREPIIQLQPLTPGITYGAFVQTVSNSGTVSAPSKMVTFQSDSSRVDALRQQMTGFFDDFNNPAGAFDELKWNNAYSGCVDHNAVGQFINAQFHAHNQISDGFCDRGENVSRPRATFDFTGRTGTVTFDMDGAERRDQWYMDFNPVANGLTDTDGHVNVQGEGNTPPTGTFRIFQTENTIHYTYFAADGSEHDLQQGQNNCGDDTRWCTGGPLITVKNVRRHWKITFVSDGTNTVHVQAFINNVLVGDVAHVPFQGTKANLLWVLFSYNTQKSNEPTSLLHWDTFGFDGPPATIETHNYIDGQIGTGDKDVNGLNFSLAENGTDITRTIKIPDSIEGATAARLMYTVQMPGYNTYAWSASDYIQINDKKYPAPDPSKFSYNAGNAPSTDTPEQVVMPIDLNDLQNLKQGDNTVTFHLRSAGILNVHMEFDFPKGQAPAYTQPIAIWKYSPMPVMADIGPAATIDSIGGKVKNGNWVDGAFSIGNWSGGQSTDKSNDNPGSVGKPASAVTGVAPIWVGITNDLAMQGEGQNPGISEYQIVVDRKVIFAKNTHMTVPAAQFVDSYDWDTTQFCNGVHEVFVEAFNPNGTASIPDYFQGDTFQNGVYFPIFIKTNNPGQSVCPDLGSFPDNLNLQPQYVMNGVNPVPPVSLPTVIPTAAPTTVNTPTPTSIPTPTPTISLPTPTPTQPVAGTSGLLAEYFSNKNLSGTPKVTRVDSTVDFNWGAKSPSAAIPVDHFSARWTGSLIISADGAYTLSTVSDDGVRLWLDNQLIIDNWYDHPAMTNNKRLTLTAGNHQIKLEYYENEGRSRVQLFASKSGFPKTIIPSSSLLSQ